MGATYSKRGRIVQVQEKREWRGEESQRQVRPLQLAQLLPSSLTKYFTLEALRTCVLQYFKILFTAPPLSDPCERARYAGNVVQGSSRDSRPLGLYSLLFDTYP